MNSFPLTAAGQNSDLKFILNSSLELEICKFLEEFGYLGRHLKSGKKEWVLRVLAPLYKPIKESSTIRELRDRNIAHAHRDDKGHVTYALQVILEKKIPQHYAEILFLGYCAVNFIHRLRNYLGDEFEEAERKYQNWIQPIFEECTQQAEGEIKSSHDIKGKLEKLLNQVDEMERELKPKKN